MTFEFLWLLNLWIACAFTVFVISRKKDPTATLAWILGFFLLPYFGIVLYLFLGYRNLRRRKVRKPNPAYRLATLPAGHEAAEVPDALKNIERVATKLSGFPPSASNRVLLLNDASATDDSLAEAIRSAKHHAHLEYYIFQDDAKGRFLRDLLVEKAKQGVECRVLADAVGSFRLGSDFFRPLKEAGGKAAFFRPFRMIQPPWSFHLRNHRKLAVIDGQIAVTGSQNISAERVRWKKHFIAWQESNLRIEGPAVDEIQAVFTEDWFFATGENLEGRSYFPLKTPAGNSLVQTLPTGPDRKDNILELVLLTAFYAARERITIMTPYFIPTPAVSLALECAAKRGVQVTVILPRVSDQPIVTFAARSWYRQLLENGVEIHEHSKKFVHAKVVTIDGKAALIGSSNMDHRSFLINYEMSLLVYDAKLAGELLDVFDRTVQESRAVKLETVRRRNPLRSFLEGAARLASPLL